jgi:hypothetical protein
MQALGSHEKASSTERNVFKGKSDIESTLKQFDARHNKLLKETTEASYDDESEILIESSQKQIVEIQRKLNTRMVKKSD